MPIDTDLKSAYNTLYDKRDPDQALPQYEAILKQHPESIVALVYKAACLEKLYFGQASWHNELTLENALDSLKRALQIAEQRGERSKIGFVQFRLFIHYFNNHENVEAVDAFNKSKQYGYDDAIVPIWESKLQMKLNKWKKKGIIPESTIILSKDSSAPTPVQLPTPTKTKVEIETNPKPLPVPVPHASVDTPTLPSVERTRTDWYQTATTIVISLFTTRLPKDVSEINTEWNQRNLGLSWNLQAVSSEFQYNINLSDEVDRDSIKFKIFTKKIEITLDKINKGKTWKTLESTNDQTQNVGTGKKKQKDWSHITLDDGDDDLEENSGSADAFFQKIYANADPDTKKAMMKSYIESNGTTLNTNWDDVKETKVSPSPPEGMELKEWTK